MDQTLTGAAGIASGEAFGAPAGPDGALHQRYLIGSAGIASGEAFGVTDGVRIPIETVPAAAWYAY